MKIRHAIKISLIFIMVLLLVSCKTTKKEIPVTSVKPAVKPIEHTEENTEAVKLEVKEQLKKFEDLYLHKKSAAISQLMKLFSKHENVEVIYGCAEEPGATGWCRGVEQVKKMMIKDSECWDEIELNLDNTTIMVKGDTAWVSTYGDAVLTDNYKKKFKLFTNSLTKSIQDEQQFNDTIAPSVLKIMIDVLYVKNSKGKLELPFVLTIVYAKENGIWLIRQMHFSYPIDPRGLDDISKIEAI